MRPDSNFTACSDALRTLEYRIMEDPFSSDAASLISEYAAMIRLLVVSVSQLHRGLRLSWRRGSALKMDQERDFTASPLVTEHIAEVVRAIDLITSLEKQYRKAQTRNQTEFRSHLRDLQIEGYKKYEQEIIDHGRQTDTTADSGSENRVTEPENKKHKLLSTNSKITSSLMRTSHMLRSSVLQSELNVSELQEQTTSLHKLNDRFDSLSGVLTTSSKVVRVIQSSSGQEKRQIYSGLAFLALCISWVLWRRVFKMPVKLALWLWFRFFRSILAILGAVPKIEVGFDPTSFSSSIATLATVTTDAVWKAAETTQDGSDFMATMVGDAVDDAFSRIRDEL
ncbi:LAFA_0F03664g1_1 [Lachancea sp. 'fantastica']|nr:LAFA_0F03664g1_1 [Lachancea sp. 'fantastica']